MLDRYTKTVLTVIACALTAIAVQMGISPAGAQLGSGCGSSRDPCYIEYDGYGGLEVEVSNWP